MLLKSAVFGLFITFIASVNGHAPTAPVYVPSAPIDVPTAPTYDPGLVPTVPTEGPRDPDLPNTTTGSPCPILPPNDPTTTPSPCPGLPADPETTTATQRETTNRPTQTQTPPSATSVWPWDTAPQHCPPTGIHYLPHNNCTHFRVCVHGRNNVLQCPRGQHWSPAHGTCEWPDRANCPRA